jgi:hypothetical protein
LIFVFGQLAADGDAIRCVLEWEGAGGLRCCFKCANCWSKGSGVAHRFRPPEHEITHATCSDFILHSTNSIVAIVGDLLAAQREVAVGTLSKTKYKELESLYGFSPTAEGVWGDLGLVHALRLPHPVSYDWPHATLQDGSLPSKLQL